MPERPKAVSDGKLKWMNFGKLFWIGLAALGCCGAANAQLGVYGMYQGTQLSGIQCGVANNGCTAQNGKVDPSGGFGGIFYDFRNFGPVRLGADVRAGVVRANKSAATSAGGKNITTADVYLAGVRGSFHTPVSFLKPYVLASVGFTRSDASETTLSATASSPKIYDKFVQYEVFAGTDVKVFPFLDFRPIEVGIGNMNRFGSGSGTSSVGVKSIGAGLVFHLSH